jgi:hypothetical protein
VPSGPDPLSLFNHHFAGWLLVLTAVFGALEESPLKKYRWIKYLWPLPLIFLAVYLLLRSDREEFSTLSNVLADPEDMQHKLFALLLLAIGLVELLRRVGLFKQFAWSYVVYAGMVGGGVFLLFHGGQHSLAVHQQHVLMGLTACAVGITKTLGDLSPRLAWLRFSVPALFLALGLELLHYYE